MPAAELPKEILLGFVAKREGTTVAIIEDTLNRIRRGESINCDADEAGGREF